MVWLDCKKELNTLMDQLVVQEMQKTKKQNIFVEDLDIFLMSGDESDIFGPSGVCDKIHFRGVRGSIVYTEKMTQLITMLIAKKPNFSVFIALAAGITYFGAKTMRQNSKIYS